MFHVKDHKTLYMFDPFEHLGPRRLNMLKNSWPSFFREEVLPNLPVTKLKPYFSTDTGRPTKELHSMLGAVILQQMFDHTDKEAVEAFAFDTRWHYALDIISPSDEAAYMSPKTLWNMRKLVVEADLATELFQHITDHLLDRCGIDTSRQRLDSSHFCSNMRHLGRITIFSTTIAKFLKNLKRHHKAIFLELDPELRDRYLQKDKAAAFSMVKPSETRKTLKAMAEDLFGLVEGFRHHEQIAAMHSYQLLIRLIEEQCIVEVDPVTRQQKVLVKPNKDVPADSLQTPSDPDATYDGHKGKGYQVQVVETWSPSPSTETDDKETAQEQDDQNTAPRQPSLITHAEVEPAHKSDAHAVEPAIDDLSDRSIAPSEILADTAYGSEGNRQQAEEQGVNLVAPAPGHEAHDKVSLSEFTFNEDGSVKHCPEECVPDKTRRRHDNYTARFDSASCSQCPRHDACPVKMGKKGHYLRYSRKEFMLASRRAAERTETFREKYRYRAGIEATFSHLDRLTGFKRSRYRTLKRVRMSTILKILGLNILRAAAYHARIRPNDATNSPQKGVSGTIVILFKELTAGITVSHRHSSLFRSFRDRILHHWLPIAA